MLYNVIVQYIFLFLKFSFAILVASNHVAWDKSTNFQQLNPPGKFTTSEKNRCKQSYAPGENIYLYIPCASGSMHTYAFSKRLVDTAHTARKKRGDRRRY